MVAKGISKKQIWMKVAVAVAVAGIAYPQLFIKDYSVYDKKDTQNQCLNYRRGQIK